MVKAATAGDSVATVATGVVKAWVEWSAFLRLFGRFQDPLVYGTRTRTGTRTHTHMHIVIMLHIDNATYWILLELSGPSKTEATHSLN